MKDTTAFPRPRDRNRKSIAVGTRKIQCWSAGCQHRACNGGAGYAKEDCGCEGAKAALTVGAQSYG
jgi:hypothetical protein